MNETLMDPYSQQSNQGYSPQQYGQNPAQPNQLDTGAYSGYAQSTPQIIQPNTQPGQSAMNQQAYQAQPYYGQAAAPTVQTDIYSQPAAYNAYGQYNAGQYQANSYAGQYPNSSYDQGSGRWGFPFKKQLIFGVIGLMLIVAGVFGIRTLSAQSPNDVFLSALENQLKIKTMHVVLSSATPKLNATTKVNYYVDLSQPSSPKAAGTVENSSAFLRTKIEVAAEFNASNKDVYTRFTNPAYENWILSTESDESLLNSSKASNLSLVRDLALGANSVQGIVLSGSLPKELRASTMKAYKNKSAYSVTATEVASTEGAQIRKYTVSLNKNVVNEIQKSVTESLGLTYSPVSEGDKSYTFYVDTKRKFITKIEQNDADNTYSLTFSEQNQSFDTTPPQSSVTTDVYLSQLQ